MIKRRGGKFYLVSSAGKVLGKHDTYRQAAAQEAAIKHSQRRRGKK